MREISSAPSIEQPPNGNFSSGFSVVIAYEDFETGKHARKTYDYLAKNLGEDSGLRQIMWKFDVLAMPKLREMAARDAAEADIVIISSHGGQELSVAVRAWVEQWLTFKNRPLALVALFDCDAGQAKGVRSYLAEVARRGQMEFFAQPEPALPAMGLKTVTGWIRNGAPPTTLQTLEGAVRQEVNIPRWGINE